MHRDIKPENLLVNEKNVLKICDFGWCIEGKSNEQRETFCGTLEYMAPEMLTSNPSYGSQVDVWALGVLLYELRHGQSPFSGNTPKEILK